MLTRELAEKVLKELAVSMYEHCINDLKLNQEQATQKSLELYNHSLVVGKIAEKIGRETDKILPWYAYHGDELFW